MRYAGIGTIMLLTSLLLAACTMPGMPGAATPAAPPQMQTAAAETVQAVLHATPLASPLASPAIPQGSPTSQILTATPAGSATPGGAAMLAVEDVTNCRSGPGSGYDRITQLQANQQVPIVGSFPSYWLVESDAGVCWIAMEFATPSGDIARVPTVTAPATPGAGAPKAAGIQSWTYSCTGGGRADVTIRWTDKSANEAGYRIYMNEEVLVELPADSTEWSGSVLLPAGLNVAVHIEAFNGVGTASSSTFTFSC